jgi:phytoene dehydrogenase-like protein
MRSLAQLKDNAGILAASPSERTPFFVLVNYHAVDCGLTRFGTYIMQLCGLDRLSNWEGLDERDYRARKAVWLDHLLAALEREFPGIAGAVVYREMATARTMQRYLNTPGGAVYGYAPLPRFTGLMVPQSRTPVPGLYLASAFAPPGGGFSGAVFAGRNAYFAARRG